MDDLFIGEARLLRERVVALEARLDRLAASGVGGTHRMVGRVFSQGAIPTTAGKFYACHPVTITGTETEGSTPNKTVDTSQAFLVDLLGGSAAVGDDLVCRRVRHRWISRPGGANCTANFTGTLKGCAGGAVGVPTVTITLRDHASGTALGTVTTDSGGNFSGSLPVTGAPGSTHAIDFTTTGLARFNDASTLKTLTCGAANNVGNLPLVPATGYHCCGICAYPLKGTLYVTDNFFSNTAGPLTWVPANNRWEGGGCALQVNGLMLFGGCQNVAVTVDIPTKTCPVADPLFAKYVLGNSVPSPPAPCIPTYEKIVTEI